MSALLWQRWKKDKEKFGFCLHTQLLIENLKDDLDEEDDEDVVDASALPQYVEN